MRGWMVRPFCPSALVLQMSRMIILLVLVEPGITYMLFTWSSSVKLALTWILSPPSFPAAATMIPPSPMSLFMFRSPEEVPSWGPTWPPKLMLMTQGLPAASA